MPLHHEIALLLLTTALLGLLALRLRQPLIVAYILIGIAAGPTLLNWHGGHAALQLFAEIGVTVLLFAVGLKLDIQLIRQLGPVALATGLGQLFFTSVFGFGLSLLLGMAVVPALYVAVALTFSSTIIIVKLLSDKREIDSLHGRIAMGFLIVQDIAVVIAMMVIGTQAAGGASNWWDQLQLIGLKLVPVALAMALLMRWVLPRLLHWMASSQELILIFAVAWGTALAATGEWLGFSKEVGAFLAGFSLASLPFREAINARLSSLRDFLLLFFFVHLGMQLDLSMLGDEIPSAAILSLFVLIGNPLIVLAIMGYMGYRRRTGFLAGLTVAQISEFSIIFMAMGLSLGHVERSALGLVTLVGLITITLSTYMILYSHRLYSWFEPWIRVFERKDPFRERATLERVRGAAIIVFGMGRYGSRLALKLSESGHHVLGVDFDPEVVKRREQGQHPHSLELLYGDAEDDEFVAHLDLRSAHCIVCTLSDPGSNCGLIKGLRRLGYRGMIAVTAYTGERHQDVLDAGADTLLTPYPDAADHAAERIALTLRQRGNPSHIAEGAVP